jgi:hypothetical protein
VPSTFGRKYLHRKEKRHEKVQVGIINKVACYDLQAALAVTVSRDSAVGIATGYGLDD